MDIVQDHYLNAVKRYPILKRDLLLKFHPDKLPLNIKELLKNDTNLNEYINFVFSDLLKKYPIKCDTDFIKILVGNRKYIKYIPPIWLAIYNLDYDKVKLLLDSNTDPNTYVSRNDIEKYIEINNSTNQSWRLEGNIINVLEFHLHINGNYQSIKNILLLLLKKGNNEPIRLLENIIIEHKNIMHSDELLHILLLEYDISPNTKMYFNNKLSLLPFCVANGSIDQVKILFSKLNPNINYLDSRQNNLLHYTACRNVLIIDDCQQSCKIIMFLRSKKKWKLDKKNKDSMTALQVLESRTNVKKEFVKDISVLLKFSFINNESSQQPCGKNNVRNDNNNLHKYKNTFYNIQTGVRGGKYIIVNDKKIYIRKKKN